MKASESIITKRESDRNYIKSLITKSNLDRVLTLSDEAVYVWATIKAEGDNFILDNKGLEPAVKADMNERNFKTAKLAGVYAFFEGSDEVLGRHMDEAFEVISESSKVLMELRKVKPKHHRLLESLLNEEKPVTEQHMLTYNFIPNTWTKKIKEYVDLAKELASERGLLWREISRKGVSYYSVSEPKEEDVKTLDEIDKEDAEASKNATEWSEQQLLDFLE